MSHLTCIAKRTNNTCEIDEVNPLVLFIVFCETLVSWGFIRIKYSYQLLLVNQYR